MAILAIVPWATGVATAGSWPYLHRTSCPQPPHHSVTPDFITICLLSSLLPTVSEALSVALKPADALSFLLCGDWPFLRQYIHLWLHWPLPTVQPQPSLRSGPAYGTILCAPMQRRSWQRTEGKAGQKKKKMKIAVMLENWRWGGRGRLQ